MIQPVRLQLSRRPGANLRDQSLAANGLPAVVVSRPSVYGNPWTIAEARKAGAWGTDAEIAAWCSSLYRKWVEGSRYLREGIDNSRADRIRARLPILRGKNLACWCALPAPGAPDPCHGAVLLDLANRPTCEAIPEPPHAR